MRAAIKDNNGIIMVFDVEEIKFDPETNQLSIKPYIYNSYWKATSRAFEDGKGKKLLVEIGKEGFVDLTDYTFEYGKPSNSYKTALEELNLSTRTFNTLKRAYINYAEELVKMSPDEIREINCLGEKGFNEIRRKLEEKGFHL